MLAGLEQGVLLGRLLEEGAGQQPLPTVDPDLASAILDPARAGGYGTAFAALAGQQGDAKPRGRKPGGGSANGGTSAEDFLGLADRAMSPPGQFHASSREQRGRSADGLRNDQSGSSSLLNRAPNMGRMGA